MRLPVLSVAILFSGCQAAPNNSAEILELKTEVAAMKIRDASEVAARLELENRVAALELTNSTVGKSAFLDPAGGPGYQIIQTNVAPLLVSFVDSAPIGDGTLIRVRLGNMSSAAFSGASLKISYNRRIPEDVDDIAEWNKTVKNVTQKIPTDLRAGTWTIISISLPGIKPENLGHIALNADLDVVALR